MSVDNLDKLINSNVEKIKEHTASTEEHNTHIKELGARIEEHNARVKELRDRIEELNLINEGYEARKLVIKANSLVNDAVETVNLYQRKRPLDQNPFEQHNIDAKDVKRIKCAEMNIRSFKKPCNNCGENMHISVEQIIEYRAKGYRMPNYCRKCNIWAKKKNLA
jgi:chromosome segregation ATPase